MATADNVRDHRDSILPVEPRQLVSEEGGIVNLAVDNEFMNSNGEIPSVMQRKKLRKFSKKKKNSIDDY